MRYGINIDTGEQVIQNCNDCKRLSIFEINEYQDPVYSNGKRLRECIKCGRYEERKKTMKKEKEIREYLADCKSAIRGCEMVGDTLTAVKYEGIIEGLEFVLFNVYDFEEGEE